MMMNGTVLAMSSETEYAMGDYGIGSSMARGLGEHDDCGDTAFFPLAPVHNALFYFFIPEISCE
jgi:hypothetical protein